MRSIGTVVLAALLLFVIYLVVGGILQGYFGVHCFPNGAVPDAWSAPNSWSEWRDILLVFTLFFFMFAGILVVIVMVALLFLVFLIRRILRENAAPAIDSLRSSLDNIRGTTEFAGETVVSPIIRTYAVVKGVRRGIGAVTNLPGRIRGRRKGKKK